MNEPDMTFTEIAQIIEETRRNAYRRVNEELILMYQRVGQFLSEKRKRQPTETDISMRLQRLYRSAFPESKDLIAADYIV